MVQQVHEVRWGLVMEGFEGEMKNFKLNAIGNREPVEVVKDVGYVVTGAGLGEETGSGVLNVYRMLLP